MPPRRKSQRATATVEDFVLKTVQRTEAVMRMSVQDLIEIMQKPMAKGGRMRVDTGFLRGSGQGSLTGMPTGPSQPDGTRADYDDGSPVPDTVILTIARFKIGGRFFWGWTANYARYREAHDGFMRLGIQNWQSIVDNNVRIARERIK